MWSYIQLLFEGILIGLLLAISIGPAFFSLIQVSIDKGFRHALLFSLGVITSDIFLFTLSFLGLSSFMTQGKNEHIALFIAGGILMGYGVYTFFKKPDILKQRKTQVHHPEIKIKKNSPFWGLFVKGFFLNIFNPIVFIFWLTISGYLTQRAIEGHLYESALFFMAGLFGTIFSTDMLKSYVGYKLKKFLRPRKILLINHIVGIILFIFGLGLIIKNLTV